MKLRLLASLLAVSGVCSAQTTARSAQPAPERAPAPLPSSLLRPGLDALERGLEAVRTDKWKLPAAGRDEVTTNLGSMHRDLESTLPPLLATADGAPTLVSGLLPVSRNITALYDVLLRVEERARMSSPADQLAALEQARTGLDSARRAFDEQMQSAAIAQEVLVKTLQAPPPPTPAPAPAPSAPTKKKLKSKSQPAVPNG